MKGKVNCTCGWSWNKSDSSAKDMYICHECGRDNSNNIPKAQDGFTTKDKPKLGAGKYYTTTGDIVDWGTPEYEEAYNRGEVVTDEGGRSPIALKEVVVKGKKKKKWWEYDGGEEENPNDKRRRREDEWRKLTGTKEYKEEAKKQEIAYDKSIIADRKTRMVDAMNAQDVDIIGNPNWREVLATETQSTGDKFRLFPNDPHSFSDDYLNSGVMIGNMASSLGSAPLRAREEDSYLPYLTSIGVPLAVGALAGLGAQSNSQFVNNLANPFAGTGDLAKAVYNKGVTSLENVGIRTSISPELREGLRYNGSSFNSSELFDLNNVRKPSGSIGNQGATSEGANNILQSLGIKVKGANPNEVTLKEMVEHLKNNPKDAATYKKFLEKEPINVSELPDGSYQINDGHHRATLSYYSGNENIPTIIKNKGEYIKKKNGGILKNGGWLDNYNDSQASAPEGMKGDGYSNVGRDYSPAWGGQFQMGGNVYPVNYVPQAQDGEKTYSYPLRDKLYSGEDEYFKANPNVGGMAAEDNQVIINPYSPLSDEEKEAVRMNEVARLAMRNGYERPTFELTPEQQEYFNTMNNGKPYSTDEQDIRETIIGRILSGDDSAGNVTPEQKKYAEELQKVLKYQTGGSIPQAQNGWLGNIEGYVNKSLGNPMRKGTIAGHVFGEKWFNPKTKKWEIEGRDNVRHSFSGRYTSEAIQDKFPSWMQYTGIPQAAGIAGATALGAGHELSILVGDEHDNRSWYDKIRESGEDAFNNMIGAGVGSLPISSEIKTNILGKLSDENRLPDGVSGRANSVYIKHQTGGSIPGATGNMYARIGAPSNGPYAKKTMASAQNGVVFDKNGKRVFPNIKKDLQVLTNIQNRNKKNKKYEIKDESLQAVTKVNNTAVKKPNFDLERSKENKTYNNAYNNALVAQKEEDARRAKLTQDQREREDYNAYNEEHGTITKTVPETNWERTKAIVSNPMTAIGYKVRNENIPPRFQHGPRNEHDYAVDWINPLQGIAALSNIPGQLGRGEFLDAGLSGLDALDLGVYARGARKLGSNQLRNISPAFGFRDGGWLDGYDVAVNGTTTEQTTKIKTDYTVTEVDNTRTVTPKQLKKVTQNGVKNQIQEEVEFMKGWTNSPMYNQMLNNSTRGVEDEQDIKDIRKERLNDLSINISDRPHLFNKDTGGSSNVATGKIKVYPNAYSDLDVFKGTAAHEISHTQDSKRNPFANLSNKLFGTNISESYIPQSDINMMNKYSKGSLYNTLFSNDKYKNDDTYDSNRDFYKYVTTPTETRARLNALRYIAKENNIYDPLTQKINMDQLEKLKQRAEKLGKGKGFDPFRQLHKQGGYSDEEILNMLNTISKNEDRNENPNIATAKNGRIIKDDRGQWDHPGEITEINSNEITMEPDPKTGKPLTKPLLGISDTGDVKLMRPGGNYKFDGKRVTEYPIAQGGITMGTTSIENDVRESSAQAAKANTEAKKQAKLNEAKLLAEQKENKRNLFPRDIKVKQPDGTIKIVNTGSPEYEEMYKAGNIQSPGAGEGDTPFFGGQLNDLVVQQKMTPLLKAKRDYGYMSNKEAFINRKKDEYIKSLGSRGNWFGATRSNFPETVLSRINREYDYNQNTRAIEDVAKAKGFDLNTRGEWIYNLTPGEKEALINSKYSAQLNPNEFSEMLSGVQQLANTSVPGKPWNFKIPGLTERELEEDRESWMSPLKIAAPFNLPGNFIANSFTNIPGSDVVETPWFGMQRMGDVSALEAMALNPLNLTMVGGAANLLTRGLPALARGLPALARGLPAAARTIGKGVNLAIENAPAAVNFAADAVKDVRGVVKQYKEISKIKNQDDYYNSVVNTSKYIDDLPKTGIDASNTITDVSDLNSVMRTIANNYMSYLKRMGGEEFAIKEARKWEKNFDTSDLATRMSDVIHNGKQVSVDELRQLGREFSNSFPEGKSFIGPAKNELAKIQKNIIFNRDKDYDTLKEFAENLKIKIPKIVTEYSPQERETISAIRELGKYKNVATWQTNKLLSDPEAMVSINKLILKLDDDVIQNLLGISKGKLLDSYKNIVPNIKKTQVDITSNPIPTADLSLVNEQNLVQPSGVSDIHPFNEKQLIASDPKYQSLIERIGQSYAKNFEPVNYEKPSSNPQGLIRMAKTDYEYSTIKDAQGNLVEKLLPTGKTKEQLIKAVRKVEASPKGTNFTGSSSLSTDSYPLTLDSGLMMSEKGLVDVSVDTGTMYLNDMGYTHTSPRLVIKDINSKIEKLEKISGKKFPRAKYNPKADRYHMYEVPKIYFTRLKQGGSINKTDENSLVKLDQLTNFTNYNKPQPGGWLSKYE